MERQTRSDLAMTVAIVLLGASLVFSGVSLLRLHTLTVGMSFHFELAEMLGIVAAALGVALLCWWLFALLCACLTAVTQARGSVYVAAFSESFSPAFMRRLVVVVLGVNLVAAPLAHATTSPAVDPQWHATIVATAPAVVDVPPASHSEPVLPHWVPQTAETEPGPLLSPALRPTPELAEDHGNSDEPHLSTGTGPDVVVQRGDSLWSIVATALGPFSTDVEVAQAWPVWYQANQATIGPDPHFILPGQVLHAP